MDCCRCYMPIHRDDTKAFLGDRVAHYHERCIDLLRMRIAELERMVVWAVEHEVCAGQLTGNERVIWFSDWNDGDRTVDRVSHDGAPASILAALKEVMGDGK